MYAIAFDLIVSDLKIHYGGNNYQNAYFEVKKTLDACGFEWTQGSVYVSKEDKDNLATVYRAINALTKLDWFKKSVRDIRAFKVEDWSDFTAIGRES